MNPARLTGSLLGAIALSATSIGVLASPAAAAASCHKINAKGVGQDLGGGNTTANINGGGLLNGTTARPGISRSTARKPDHGPVHREDHGNHLRRPGALSGTKGQRACVRPVAGTAGRTGGRGRDRTCDRSGVRPALHAARRLYQRHQTVNRSMGPPLTAPLTTTSHHV
jgi:hypothetical protein